MTKRERNERMLLADRHLRLIAQLSFHYWKGLPSYTRAYLDLQEVISGTVLVVTACSLRYEKEKGAETTFVYRIANNHLKNLLVKHQTQSRAGDVVEVAEWNGGSIPALHQSWQLAKSGFEELLRSASEGLRQALDRFFDDRRFGSIREEELDELRDLTKRYHISRDDFAAVLRVV